MVAYARPTPHVRRADNPLDAPTGVAGIDGAATTVVDTAAAATQTQLAVNKSGTGSNVGSAPPLNIGDSTSQIVVTTATSEITLASSSPTSTSTDTSSPDSTAIVAAASSKPIAMSTVIGSCVGAFIGATALILLGLWFYRRYSRSLKSRGRARGPFVHARNLQADEHRRQSRLEPWNKLEDTDDKWEDMYQTKETREVDQVAPMEKLTMFKKTPSVRTAYTHKSTNIAAFDFPQSYAQLGSVPSLTPMPEPRPFLDRIEVPSIASNWETDTIGNASYLTARSAADGGAVSPTLHMAIPTPPLTVSQTHKWESAEVVHYSDAPQSEADNDHYAEGNERRSLHNPFFNAQQEEPLPRSRSNSITVVKSAKSKGKERMRYSEAEAEPDPFDDTNGMTMPRPAFVQHAPTASSSSTESKERAMQSLIAALDISEEEVRNRLRIASMQPSMISQISSAGGYDDDTDVTKEFPLPPPRSGGTSSNFS